MNVIGKGVNVMRKKVCSQKEPTNGTKSTHGVHEANVHRTGIPLYVVVNICCSQSKQWRSSTSQQKL